MKRGEKKEHNRYCVFAEHLYVGSGIGNPEDVQWRIRHGAGQVSVYLLAEAPENHDTLAIIHAGFLTQDYYRTRPLKVYGMARGMTEAQELLVQISDEACKSGFPGNLKAYLDAREHAQKEAET